MSIIEVNRTKIQLNNSLPLYAILCVIIVPYYNQIRCENNVVFLLQLVQEKQGVKTVSLNAFQLIKVVILKKNNSTAQKFKVPIA